MDREEMLEKMITRARATRRFDDWLGVITNYAACLEAIESKIDANEMHRLLNAGTDPYRTLARAEACRRGP